MAGASLAVGTSQAAPQLIIWQHSLSCTEIEVFDASIPTLVGWTLVGRMVGHSHSCSMVCETALRTPDRRVADMELVGRTIFRVVLSDETVAQAFLQSSPFIADSRMIHLWEWYQEFTRDDVDSRFDIPRFRVTVAFPGIPIQFRHLISTMAGRMGMVVRGFLVTGVGTPRIQVWAPAATVFPDVVEFL